MSFNPNKKIQKYRMLYIESIWILILNTKFDAYGPIFFYALKKHSNIFAITYPNF